MTTPRRAKGPAGQFVIHEHHFVRGPRTGGHYENGKWHDGKITHSHEGGDVPHEHANTGPSCYGYRQHRKYSAKPKGESLPGYRVRTEEENTFELVITDSALISTPTPLGQKVLPLRPIGNKPLEEIGLTIAAEVMVEKFGMKCVIRDERTKGGAA